LFYLYIKLIIYLAYFNYKLNLYSSIFLGEFAARFIEMTTKESTGPEIPAAIEQQMKVKQRGPAPVHLWTPELSGVMNLVIERDGRWIHEGQEIKRQSLIKLFASIIRLDNDGHYYLVTPHEKYQISVVDKPFIVTRMDLPRDKDKHISLYTNMDESFDLDDEHPLRIVQLPNGEPRPYVRVRSNLEALVCRNVFYEMVDCAQEKDIDGERAMELQSGKCGFKLGRF